MMSGAAFNRQAHRSLSRSAQHRITQRRGLAAAASGSFAYQTGDATGVKFASRDLPGPTTTLAVVAKAGTRYQPLPGLTEGLEKFAFKGTERRSALRITREVELLGGEVSASHSRENLVVGAKFLRGDLPYFAELLAEVVSQTRFTRHEFDEQVHPSIKNDQKRTLAKTADLAVNSAHGIAFHRGLGDALHPTSSTPLSRYLNVDYLRRFSQLAYNKANLAVVANGADAGDFAKWVKEFFADLPSGIPSGESLANTSQSQYYGGEERIAHDSGNTMILGFPGSSSFTGGNWKPEISVLASLLGGQSSIKWSTGFSVLAKATASIPGVHIETENAVYSDAGLLYVKLDGNPMAIREASREVVKAIKGVAAGDISKEDFRKAIASAKFRTLERGQEIHAGIELTGAGLISGGKAHQFDEAAKSIESVTESQLKEAAKTLLEGKATVAAVGDLYALPFAEEIGLKI